MRTLFLAAILLFSTLFTSAGNAQGAASQPSGGAASQPSAQGQVEMPSDKRATKEVDVKKECGVLADVFKHRAALHFLKNDKDAREAILKTIDPESASRSEEHTSEL